MSNFRHQITPTIILLAIITLFMDIGVFSDDRISFTFKGCFILGSLLILLGLIWFSLKIQDGNSYVSQICKEQESDLKEFCQKMSGWDICFIVALSLFAELSLIRLHYSAFGVFGFYKNISLMACFLISSAD